MKMDKMKKARSRVNATKPTFSDNGSQNISEIKFYRSNEKPYGIFSNLYRRNFEFEGRKYPTAEHAYQAGKPRRITVQKWLLRAPSPSLVAMAAHGLYTWEIASNWSEIKYDRMRQVLRAKFSQHEDLKNILISTGQARLVEVGKVDSPVNRTWGEVNGKGQNLLGVMLMELRLELIAAQNGSAKPPKGKKTTVKKIVRSARPKRTV
jgi:ribA/ribD-fused uncharacterized protein